MEQKNHYRKSARENKYLVFLALLYLLAIVTSLTLSPRLFILHVPFTDYSVPMPGGLYIFPFSYFLGDVITEVYGYARARQIVWFTVFASLLYILSTQSVIKLPPPSFYQDVAAYNTVFEPLPRFFGGVLMALLVGSFINDYLMSRLKIYFKGRYLWARAVGSTIIGETIVAFLGTTIAWAGTLNFQTQILPQIIVLVIFNILYELVLSPFIYVSATMLKKAEGIDVYDYRINYNPFSLRLNESEEE